MSHDSEWHRHISAIVTQEHLVLDREYDTQLVFWTPEGYRVYVDVPAEPENVRLIPFADLNLNATWVEHRNRYGGYDQVPFRIRVMTMVCDPEAVAIRHCDECLRPGRLAEMVEIEGGRICPACTEHYRPCGRCGGLARYFDATVDPEGEVCTRCRDRHYLWCNYCDGWYDRDVEHEVHPGPYCKCESPMQVFSIRNDGHGTLANDVTTTVTLPSGVISEEGMEEIAAQIRWEGRRVVRNDRADDYYDERNKWNTLSHTLEDGVGAVWQTKQGNFTKRLSRHAYKKFGLKISPEMLSNIGNIATAHSTGASYEVAVTRDLNLSPAQFAHAESCWWGSYAASRCALKSNGGFALRAFDSWGGVAGRAWVMPLRNNEGPGQALLVPTFEVLEANAYIVFNGYGVLNGYVPARILCHMVGMTYRKVGFDPGGENTMYVNNESGYLVATEEIAARFDKGQYLDLDLDHHSSLYATETNEGIISHVA